MNFCELPLADKVCGVIDAAKFVSDPGAAIGNWMAKSAGELAAAATDLAADAVNATTNIDLNAAWFRDNYETLLPIGLIVLVATFCAQLIRAAMKRDGQALAQAFTGTASGVLFAFAAIALTTVAIEVTDALSDGLFRAANTSVEDAVRRMVKVHQIGALTGLGWLVMVFAALAAAIGAFLYWCVMMVRKIGILVLVTLAVFAAAGGGWEATRRWRRGWIEATATLIVSKLLMTVVFLLGMSAMGKTEADGGIAALSDVMAGIVIMMLVLLCPYATFKFVHWAAEGTNGEDIHRAGGAGAQLARQHAERAGRKAASMAATAGTGGAAGAAEGAGSAAPQGPDFADGSFPGDIASSSTAGGGSGGEQTGQSSGQLGGVSPAADAMAKGVEQAVQEAPVSPGPGNSSSPNSGTGSGSGGQQDAPAPVVADQDSSSQPASVVPGVPPAGYVPRSAPTSTAPPPPQGAPPAPDTAPRTGPGTSSGPASPPPSPTGT
ncbi:SCO6881 family protein [Streptomyces sp. NBC_00690]|uniref:SCO6881 family protein n=1 Tax=Streptomyces sp. NBC_00690 TaxID=2975808 RepID=UPI002E28FB55|nr:type IV secretion system protein [Streptomyces sp. NBC_00690]